MSLRGSRITRPPRSGPPADAPARQLGAPPTLLVTDVNRVQRSGDGGVTWSTVYTLFFRASAWGTVAERLFVDPAVAHRVFVVNDDGLLENRFRQP
jgi:hypothetical protein